MKLIHDSTLCLLHLLLLAELFVHSSSRSIPRPPLCDVFRPMIHQVDSLMNVSKKLHDLTGEELMDIEAMEHRLDGLHIQQTFTHFSSLQVNESLSQLLLHTQDFRLHVDWLKTAKENVGLPSKSAKNARAHLLQLSSLINASLHQIGGEVPQSTSPSLPAASGAFDVRRFSVEISQQLQAFCRWSKRVFLFLQKHPCPQH